MKKKFACTKCDYSTDKRPDFKRHCVTHTGVKAYKCDTCGKCSSTKGNLTKHIKSVHTLEKEYKCNVCEKVSHHRHVLLQHVKTVHDKIRSFVCNECDKTFSQCRDLKIHMRTHTNETPF